MTSIISAQNLTKTYRIYPRPIDRLKETFCPWKQYHTLFYALHDISFDVCKGEHLGIIGVNGAGKSTLLQILTGVLSPTSGDVSIEGRVAALLELGAGFNPELTGRENVAFLMSILGVSSDRADAFFEDIIEFAELGDFIDRPVKLYSSGMFARLAFSMNIAALPDILIVDEALAVGDVFFQQKCQRRMKEYKEKGTILFVSHDTASVMDLCKNALWLENGRVKEFGPSKDVCEHYLASNYKQNFADKDVINNSVAACRNGEGSGNEARLHELKYGSHIMEQVEKLKNSPEFDFDAKDSFGEGAAVILRCKIENLSNPSSVFFYGDVCRIIIYFLCEKELSNTIVGFFLKDRFGKPIYGTNSFRYHTDWRCNAGGTYAAIFEFAFPDLLSGEYMVTLAIAEGTLESHRQQHWVYDAATIQYSSDTNDGTVVAAKCSACDLMGG